MSSLDRHFRKRLNGGRRLHIKPGELTILKLQSHRSRHGIEPRPAAIRAKLPVAFLPAIPGLLNGIRPRAAFHVRQIEQFAKPAATRAPTLRRVIAEVFRVESLKGAAALGTRTLGRVHGNLLILIEGE